MIRPLLRGLAAATLAAGAVGLVRQRAEAVAVRRGRLVPASAAADLVPRSDGPLADRVARWVPPAPSTRRGRVLAAVWAAPLTAVGLFLSLVARSRPRWEPELGCFVTRDVGNPSRAVLTAIGAEANAIGQVVVTKRVDPPPTLLAHELVHVRQAERLGVFLAPLYVWATARYGYRDNPFERAARRGAAASRHATPARPAPRD